MSAAAKPKVVLTPQFIEDLQTSKHANFARQVLNHVFSSDGTFKADANDHQYDGIANGWIRWVSMGGVGIRVIYIRTGELVHLYRAVGKQDESGLSHPKDLDPKVIVEGLPEDILNALGESPVLISSRLLKNTSPTFLRETFRSMYHLPHSEVILISPWLSQPLFRRDGEIGRFLDRAIEEGTRSVLVTLPPAESDLEFFDDLALRNVEVYFTQNLRSRLYLFQVNKYRLSKAAKEAHPTAILGSAELTHHSLDMGGIGRHEEICYRFPESHFTAFHNYAGDLLKASIDLPGHKIKLRAS